MTKESKRPGVVYVVTEVSEPDRVRYVGRTIQPIQTRIQEHWAQARNGRKGAFQFWLQKRESRKDSVTFTVIGNYDSVESVNAAEVEAIRAYRLLGMADLNITDGGQGATGSKWTDARREKQMRSVSRGDQHVHRKLSSDIVREIRNLRSTVWVSSRVLAEKYGVSKSQITAILRNREWFDAEFNPESIVKPPRKGDNSYHKKLSWPEVREIRALALSQYISPYELAKQFNTSQPNIRDILNNKIWVDKAYNPREVIPRPASLKPRGGKQGKRLTPEQVVEIRHLFRAGWKLKELSARYGVVENSVSRIVNGVTWGHLREGLE